MDSPSETTNELSKVLESLKQGLYILTSADAERVNGCPVVWVSKASFRPFLMAVFVQPRLFTYELIIKSGCFCLNVLGRDGIELARKFGSVSGREVNKFEGVPYHLGKSGAPILETGIVAYIDCRLHTTFPAGDHVCLLGKIVDGASVSEEEPVLYDPRDFYSEDTE